MGVCRRLTSRAVTIAVFGQINRCWRWSSIEALIDVPMRKSSYHHDEDNIETLLFARHTQVLHGLFILFILLLELTMINAQAPYSFSLHCQQLLKIVLPLMCLLWLDELESDIDCWLGLKLSWILKSQDGLK